MFSFKSKNKAGWMGWLSTLSIVALLCFQIYWLYNSYKSTYNKFTDDAREALLEACDKEQALQKENVSQTLQQTMSMYPATANIDSTQAGTTIVAYQRQATHITLNNEKGINLIRLDSLYRQALAAKGLYVNFVLEAEPQKGGEVRSIGEHRKKGAEIKVSGNNIRLTSVNAGATMYINMSQENISAYVQCTPMIIFRQMLGIVLISLLLFCVILFCLAYQLRVIGQQKTAAKMKNDFIANFTHELKTPIAVVYAALDNMERNPSQLETAVEMGKRQLKRLSDSVEKILSLSVEEHGRLALHREEVVIDEWLTSLLEPFRLKTDKEITFEISFQPEHSKVDIDKVHLANALNNIIDNAIKYSSEKVHLKITSTHALDYLHISVQDNGFGIADDDLKKIFDRFYRVKNLAEKIKGFGLGLNYAKTIVELHGGTIVAESKLGQGSTFIVTLPV